MGSKSAIGPSGEDPTAVCGPCKVSNWKLNWFPAADVAVQFRFPVDNWPVNGFTIMFDAIRLHPLTLFCEFGVGPDTPGALGKVAEGPASLICQSKLPVPPGPIVKALFTEVPGL